MDKVSSWRSGGGCLAAVTSSHEAVDGFMWNPVDLCGRSTMEQMWPTHYQMFQGMAKAPLSYMGRIGGSVELMMTSPATMLTDVGNGSNSGGSDGSCNINSGDNYGNDGYKPGGYGNNGCRVDEKNQGRSDVCSRSGKRVQQQRWWWRGPTTHQHTHQDMQVPEHVMMKFVTLPWQCPIQVYTPTRH